MFFLDRHGRALTEKSMNKQLSALFDHMGIKNVEAVGVSGQTINKPEILLIQITGREVDEWELVYTHDAENGFLLDENQKRSLVNLLKEKKNIDASSAEYVSMLINTGAHKKGN